VISLSRLGHYDDDDDDERCSVQPNKKRKISDVDSLSGSLGRSFAPPPPPGVDAAALHAIKHEPVYSDASFGR